MCGLGLIWVLSCCWLLQQAHPGLSSLEACRWDHLNTTSGAPLTEHCASLWAASVALQLELLPCHCGPQHPVTHTISIISMGQPFEQRTCACRRVTACCIKTQFNCSLGHCSPGLQAPLTALAMLLIAALGALLLPVIILAVLLSAQPDVPSQLSAWPSLGFLYLQLLRAAVKGKKPPTELKGKPIKVCSLATQCMATITTAC